MFRNLKSTQKGVHCDTCTKVKFSVKFSKNYHWRNLKIESKLLLNFSKIVATFCILDFRKNNNKIQNFTKI